MLCYLRYPGRALRSGERPPPALLAFAAEQIGILPDAVDGYLAAERNRQRHAVECQEQLGLRPFGKRAAAELASALLPQAIEDDRLARLAELVMETCRQHRIVVPSPAALERVRLAPAPLRPELSVAFAAAGDETVAARLLILPSADTRRVLEEMVPKMRAACDARRDRNLVIIARTDALQPNGWDDVVLRARSCRAAGADLIFVDGIKTLDDLKRYAEKLGDFFSDGVSVVHPDADLSAVPEAVFLSTQTLTSSPCGPACPR